MAKMGRPPKNKAERRDNVLRVSLSQNERTAIDEAAQLAYPELDPERVSARWARDALLRAAKRAMGLKRR